jgi:hypothetical protein
MTLLKHLGDVETGVTFFEPAICLFVNAALH